MNPVNGSKPPAPTTVPRAVSIATLILSLLAATAATAAVVLSLAHSSAPRTDNHLPADDVSPFVQEGTVKPEGQAAGTVFYPLPYASPPHLSLSPGGRYCLARQDELGFTWVDRLRIKDSPDLAKEYPELGRMLGDQARPGEKADGPQPEFTWGSRGVRAGPNAGGARLFQQTGSFECSPGDEGEVYFPLPYASPPNVELTSLQRVTVTTCTPLGFAWKSAADGVRNDQSGKATWVAKGVKATPESQRAGVGLPQPHTGPMPGRLLRQEGRFAPIGKEGEVHFPFPYASPPNVELFAWNENRKRHVTWATVGECTATGFKWRMGEVIDNPRVLDWVAKGIPASEVRK
jgi:hypothetical protein